MTTRAILVKLVEAVQAFGEERYINGDDERAMDRAGAKVDRAMHRARVHLAATAPKRKQRSEQDTTSNSSRPGGGDA